MGFHNISEAGGIGLAAAGLTIVFVALVLVSLFIAGMPRLLPFVNSVLPIIEGHHGAPMPSTIPPAGVQTEEEVIAAIGFAMHIRRRD